MATSYSTNLALALPATGELSGTWGTTVNSNITNMLDEALGYQAYSATGGSDTLTIPDGTTGVARSIYIQLNGTGGGTVNVPATKTKMYFVFNNTASAITFKVTGQTGVSIPAAAKIALVSNGTDIITAENYFAALTLGAALPVASGGTGTTSTTFVNLATNVTGTLPIANGGTGTTSTTFVNLATNVTGNLPVTNLNAGTSASATTFWRGDGSWGIPSGTGGTVTSVAATVPSIFSVAGSPITASGTLAMTYSGTALPVANGGTALTTGTSGGVLAYTAAGTLASSALLTQYGVVYGGGAGATPVATAAGTTGQVLTATTGGAPTWSASAVALLPVSARTSNTILGTADTSTLIDVTSGTFTQTYTAAATLASGWFCYYRNTGTGVVTHDPNGGELIGGTTTATMNPGDVWLIQCTGTAFVLTRLVGSNSVVYTSGSNTFTVPSGVTRIYVECWGGGGGATQGAGAGGGGYAAGWVNTTPGATLTGVVGAGGTTSGTPGGDGASTTFSTFTANGGTGGAGGSSATAPGGTASGGTTNISGGNGGCQNTSGGMTALAVGGAAPRGGLGQVGTAGGSGGTPGGGAASGAGTIGNQTGGSGQINISWV